MIASEIINKFGGQSALARLLGKGQSTVQHWYNNRIPAKWQRPILDLAKEEGVSLTAEDFLEEIPKATHVGEIKIGDFVIPCAVLEDGTRLLSERGATKALGGKRGGSHWRRRKKDPSGAYLPVYLSANNLKPFINEELASALNNPIKHIPEKGGIAHGLRAEAFPKVCEVWLKARDAGALKPQQQHIAVQADILIRGLAHIGIIALVDEATGYQEVRDRLALQEILDRILTDEWAKWTKTFPDDYYKELFRLKNVPYPPKSINKPQYVGHWTNDVIYSRLAPRVVKELKKKNPVTLAGYRKRRHHQHFTRDYGHPALKEHLSNVVFLMKSCPSWKDFKARLDMISPKYGDTMPLRFPKKKMK